MVLVAPAPDFTARLMPLTIPPEGQAAIRETGVWMQPSPYGDPNPITAKLLEDGARWSILDAAVPIKAPVRILQGGEDPDVPWRHALELAQAIQGRDVVFTLIKDGDHRLSRPQDIARLVAAVDEVAG
jgi:pimeloyl-ACP methyl ester carboxylesterase